MIHVTARVHPFAPAQREVREFAAGSTIKDIVTALVPVEVGRVIIMVDGEEVAREEWGAEIHDESLVTVSVVPAGSADEMSTAADKTVGWSAVLGFGLIILGGLLLNPILAVTGIGIAAAG